MFLVVIWFSLGKMSHAFIFYISDISRLVIGHIISHNLQKNAKINFVVIFRERAACIALFFLKLYLCPSVRQSHPVLSVGVVTFSGLVLSEYGPGMVICHGILVRVGDRAGRVGRLGGFTINWRLVSNLWLLVGNFGLLVGTLGYSSWGRVNYLRLGG